jgi:hypothetical protein
MVSSLWHLAPDLAPKNKMKKGDRVKHKLSDILYTDGILIEEITPQIWKVKWSFEGSNFTFHHTEKNLIRINKNIRCHPRTDIFKNEHSS